MASTGPADGSAGADVDVPVLAAAGTLRHDGLPFIDEIPVAADGLLGEGVFGEDITAVERVQQDKERRNVHQGGPGADFVDTDEDVGQGEAEDDAAHEFVGQHVASPQRRPETREQQPAKAHEPLENGEWN